MRERSVGGSYVFDLFILRKPYVYVETRSTLVVLRGRVEDEGLRLVSVGDTGRNYVYDLDGDDHP